jgi:hypothetical protein
MKNWFRARLDNPRKTPEYFEHKKIPIMLARIPSFIFGPLYGNIIDFFFRHLRNSNVLFFI